MRTLLTVLLCPVFIAATCILTFLDGVARVAADPDALLQATEQAGVRPAIVDVAEELVARSIAPGQPPDSAVRTHLRSAVDDVLADDWFDAKARRCHEAILSAITAAPATSVLDLRRLKTELRQVIAELGQRAHDTCVSLAGAEQCSGVRPPAQDPVALVADEIDLAALVTHDPAGQRTVRRWLARAPQLRLAGAAFLAGLLGLIVLVNIVPLRRLLGATGASLLLAAVAALVLHAVAAGVARAELERRLPAVRAFREADPVVRRHAVPALTRLATGLTDSAAVAARGPLTLAAVAGAVLLVGAAMMRRSSRP